jgi:hypothetical protein
MLNRAILAGPGPYDDDGGDSRWIPGTSPEDTDPEDEDVSEESQSRDDQKGTDGH